MKKILEKGHIRYETKLRAAGWVNLTLKGDYEQ